MSLVGSFVWPHRRPWTVGFIDLYWPARWENKMTETKTQAAETAADIAEQIIKERGDMADAQLYSWARAYTHWREAVALLTTRELADAIHAGRLRVID